MANLEGEKDAEFVRAMENLSLGVAEWNEWVDALTENIIIDLSGADLSKASGLSIKGANFRRACLKGVNFSKQNLQNKLKQLTGLSHFKLVFIFNDGADLSDLFTLIWLIGGNLEPDRDISILNSENENSVVFVDATFKTESHDNFKRDWPNVVTMDDETISGIDKKWDELGLGEFIKSPSLKFKSLVKGGGAVRE